MNSKRLNDDDENDDDIEKRKKKKDKDKPKESIELEGPPKPSPKRKDGDNDDDDDNDDSIDQRSRIEKEDKKKESIDLEEPSKSSPKRRNDDDNVEDDDKRNKITSLNPKENTKECQTDITLDPEGFPPNMETDIQTACTIKPTDSISDSKIKEKLRKHYEHEEGLQETERIRKDLEEADSEKEERKLIPPSFQKSSGVSDSYSRITAVDEPEFRSVIGPENIIYVTDTDIQRRINQCETYTEKQLLNGVSDTMKTLMMEMNNLRILYDKVCKEQDQNMDEQLREDDTIEQISELDKYEYDLLTHDADEFPLAIVITDTTVLKYDDLKFDLPARNIKDFDNLFIDSHELSSKPMMDTDLLEPAGPLDRNIFTVGSKLPGEMDPLAVKPMWDSNLKGGIVPRQVGLTKRRDRTIFLEDYVQYIMQDHDLLVKSLSVEPEDKGKTKSELQYRLQYDTDLGRSTRIRKEIIEKMANCKCKIGEHMSECVCGCPGNHFICDMNNEMQNDEDNFSSVSVESDVKVPRGMFDYDLYGKFIKKTQPKCADNVMWDYNLCHSASVNRIDIRDSNDSFDQMYNKDPTQRGMFDFDLIDRTMIDPKVYLDKRAMFDFDLEQASDDVSPYDSGSDDLPMMDYNLKGHLIARQDGQLSYAYIKRVRKGRRAMFDVDLKEARITDKRLSFSDEEVSGNLPQPMWDYDVGKTFVPIKKKGRKRKLKKKLESSNEDDGYTHSNNSMPIPWNKLTIPADDQPQTSKRQKSKQKPPKDNTQDSVSGADSKNTTETENSSSPPSSGDDEVSDIERKEMDDNFVDALSTINETNTEQANLDLKLDTEKLSESERTDVLNTSNVLSNDENKANLSHKCEEYLSTHSRSIRMSEDLTFKECNSDPTPDSSNVWPISNDGSDSNVTESHHQSESKRETSIKSAGEASNKRESIDVSSRKASTGSQESQGTNKLRHSDSIQPEFMTQVEPSKREGKDTSSPRASTKSALGKEPSRTSVDYEGTEPSKRESVGVSSLRGASTKSASDKKSSRTSDDHDGIDLSKRKSADVPREGEISVDVSPSRGTSTERASDKKSPRSSKDYDGIDPNKRESVDVSPSRGTSNERASDKKSPRSSKDYDGEDPNKRESADVSSSRRASSKSASDKKSPRTSKDSVGLKAPSVEDACKEILKSTISSPNIDDKPPITKLCVCEKPPQGKDSVASEQKENISLSLSVQKTERSLCECEKNSKCVPLLDSDSDQWLRQHICAASKQITKPICPFETPVETSRQVQVDSLSICECSEIKFVKPPDRQPCKACVYAAQIQSSNSEEISEKSNELITAKTTPDNSKTEAAVDTKTSNCTCDAEHSKNNSLYPILKIILPFTDNSRKKNILEIGIRQTTESGETSNISLEQDNKRQTGGENTNKKPVDNNGNWSSEVVQIPNTTDENPSDRNPSKTLSHELTEGWSVTSCRQHFGEPKSHDSVAYILQQGQYDCNFMAGDDKITKHIKEIEKIISKYTDLSSLKLENMYDKSKMNKIFKRWLKGGVNSLTSTSNDSSLNQSRSQVLSECRQFIKQTKTKSEIVAVLDYEVLSNMPENNDSFMQYENELRELEHSYNQDNRADVAENICRDRNYPKTTVNISEYMKNSLDICESRLKKLKDCTTPPNLLYISESAQKQLDACECCLKPLNVSKSATNISNYKVNNSECKANISECRAIVSDFKTKTLDPKCSGVIRNICSVHKSPCTNVNSFISRISAATTPSMKPIKNGEFDCLNQSEITEQSKTDVVSNLSTSPTVSETNLSFTNTCNESQFKLTWSSDDYSHSQDECGQELPIKISCATILSQQICECLRRKVDESEFKISWNADDYSHFSKDDCISLQNKTCQSETLLNFERVAKVKEDRWYASTHKITASGLLLDQRSPSCPTISQTNPSTIGSMCDQFRKSWSADYSYSIEDDDCVSVQDKTQYSEPLLNFEYIKRVKKLCYEASNHMIGASGMDLGRKCLKSELEIINICPSISALKVFYSCSNIPFGTDWSAKFLPKLICNSEYKSCEKFDQLITAKSSTDYYSLDNSCNLTSHEHSCKYDDCEKSLPRKSIPKSISQQNCTCRNCQVSDCKCSTVNSTKLNKNCMSQQSWKSGVSTLTETEVSTNKFTNSEHVSKDLETCNCEVCQCNMTVLVSATKSQQTSKLAMCNCGTINLQSRTKLDLPPIDQETPKCEVCSAMKPNDNTKCQQSRKSVVCPANLSSARKSNDNSICQKNLCGICEVDPCKCVNTKLQSKKKSVSPISYDLITKSNDNSRCKCLMCKLDDCICETAKLASEKKYINPELDQQNRILQYQMITISNDDPLYQENCKCEICKEEKCKCDTTEKLSSETKSNDNHIYEQSCQCEICKDDDCTCENAKLLSKKISVSFVVDQDICICRNCRCESTNLHSASKSIDNLNSGAESSGIESEICSCSVCQCETVIPGLATKSNGNRMYEESCKCGVCKENDCKCENAKLQSGKISVSPVLDQESCKCGICHLVDCKCESEDIRSARKSNDYPISQQGCNCGARKLDDCKCTIANVLLAEHRRSQLVCTFCFCKCGTTNPCSTSKPDKVSICQQRCNCGICNFKDCTCQGKNLHSMPSYSKSRKTCTCAKYAMKNDVDCTGASNYNENRVRSICNKSSGVKVHMSDSESIICCEEINSSISSQRKCPPCDSKLKPFKCAANEWITKKSKSKTTVNICPARIYSISTVVKPSFVKKIRSEPKICPANIYSSKTTTKHADPNEISIKYQRKDSFCKCPTESESVLRIKHSASFKATKRALKSPRPSRSKRKRSKRGKRQRSHESKKSSERNISSTTSTASQTERKSLRGNVVTKAMISYENEIRPLKEALLSLQTKIRNLNFVDVGTISPTILNTTKYSPIDISGFPNIYQSPTRPIRECFCPDNTFGLHNLNYHTNLAEHDPTTSRNLTKPYQNNLAGNSRGVDNTVPVRQGAKKAANFSPMTRDMNIKAEDVPMSSKTSKPINQEDFRKYMQQNLPNLKIEPENFILGSTPLKTDPDMLFPWRKPPDKCD